MNRDRSPCRKNVCGWFASLVIVTLVVCCLSAGLTLQERRPAVAVEGAKDAPEIAREMAAAASNFLASIEGQRDTGATYLFQDEERRSFHYFPIPRRGMPLARMNAAQRALAFALVNTGMSHRGFAKTATIMSLGQLLRDTTPEDEQNVYRDSDRYYLTIFGKPLSPDATWGWRFEGFHVSLHFTIVRGRWIAVAPSFLGSIPAIVKEGPRKGLQVLRVEEELARRLARSLDAEQRDVAFGPIPDFLTETVGGLVTANKPAVELGPPHGIAASKLTPRQSDMLMDLVREYAHRHRRPLAERDLARIADAGVENIHFAWAGSVEPGEPHHYMIQGTTFVIEYDNTQDDANHVHCVWRDRANDFGRELLRRHYAEKHGSGGTR